MLWNKDKLFCEISPTTYAISMQKGIVKRHLDDFFGKESFAATRQKESLPNLISDYKGYMIKKGPGIDPELQHNKVVNIDLACRSFDGLILHPGEVFSFWRNVGKTTKRRGFQEGRVIVNNQMRPGVGGGLCNLGNSLHRMVLHSPLEVTEFHSHSDALAPDAGERVPFSAGTSVSYNYIDYRFRNNTDQDIQIRAWCEDDFLYAELRSEREFPWTYRLVEEGHRFRKEGEKYYRVSKIYKETLDRETGEVIDKKLVLDNHSEVMFDYSLIPEDLIALE